ncbi:hypothetical protein PHLGIDRAFT_68676 [Phlebiopsis gigantea 11061_1 CR5-6]|uniref:EF-hand domain-containing protein n=1 Tax=Phlebiopsis gigantea (strain 11061_1 CR5-6) TaxID=745531 RepID=A0A0C3S196_PHLG1|nr:hypothetical protein PHLGIDRAFT_68676 [Phlebiopsis gigantea 11061_1 CR5-6]
MSDSEADPSFSVLPARLRRRVDPRKKQKIQGNDTPSSSVQPAAGGFIVDDAPAPGGFLVDDAPGGFVVDDAMDGGFIPESSSSTDDDETMNTPNRLDQIPLSTIPSALQLLDLQPDDEDVLSVFRNAATGWENKHDSFAEKQDEAHLLVGRKDWRAVCAALMDVGAGDGQDQAGDHDDVEMGAEEDEGEEWVESDDASDFDEGDESGDSDDEYVGDGSAQSKSRTQKSTVARKGKTRRRASSPLSPLGSSDYEDFVGKTKPITGRQKTESRRTFALFFPDVPDTDLDKKRVMIRDIARVAGLLKEKLTTEDIVEMLEAFSSSPDKSMSLRDFECMMVAARLA